MRAARRDLNEQTNQLQVALFDCRAQSHRPREAGAAVNDSQTLRHDYSFGAMAKA